MLHDAHPQTGIRHDVPVSQLPVRPTHAVDDSLRLVTAVSLDAKGIAAKRGLMRPRLIGIPTLPGVARFGVSLAQVLTPATRLPDFLRFIFRKALKYDVRSGYDLCCRASICHLHHFNIKISMNKVE